MTETMHGHVTALIRQGDGDQLAADALAGATTLTVLDVADFSEDGGQLRLGDVVYDYIAIDDDASTITLVAPGLTAPAATDDPVDVWDPEAEATVLEFLATVVDDTTEDVIQAVVAHDLADRMADNIRGLVGESVVCEEDGDGIWVLTRVLGRSPAIDADYVVIPGTGLTLPTTLEEIYAQADEIAAAAELASYTATVALGAANGKNVNYYSNSGPGVTPNNPGDNWFQRDGTPAGNIIAQYEGLGGTSWASRQLRSEVIANLDVGKLTAGSGLVNSFTIKTLLTLGDASNDGIIKSHNFEGSSVGVLISKTGLVAKGGTIAGAGIYGGLVEGATVRTSDDGNRIELLGDAAGVSQGVIQLHYFGNVGSISVGSTPQGDGIVLGYAGALLLIGTTGVQAVGNLGVTGNLSTTGSINATGGVSAGGLKIPTPTTTAAAANVYMDSAGNLLKSTSSRRYKRNIEPLQIDVATVLALEPKMYESRHKGDHGSYVGFIAEDARDLGLEQWVVSDADDKVDGFAYGAWTVAQQVVLRWQQQRIEDLQQQLTDRDTQFAALVKRVEAVEASNKSLTARLAKIPGLSK